MLLPPGVVCGASTGPLACLAPDMTWPGPYPQRAQQEGAAAPPRQGASPPPPRGPGSCGEGLLGSTALSWAEPFLAPLTAAVWCTSASSGFFPPRPRTQGEERLPSEPPRKHLRWVVSTALPGLLSQGHQAGPHLHAGHRPLLLRAISMGSVIVQPALLFRPPSRMAGFCSPSSLPLPLALLLCSLS